MKLMDFDTFGMRVLCIDDSKTQLLLYVSQLESVFTVSIAINYQEAVANLTTSRPDLIVLDMNMPKVTGLEFLDILSSTPNYARIPVIVVSGEEDPIGIKEAFLRGAADYIKKPYDPEELILRINRIFKLIGFSDKKDIQKAEPIKSAQKLLIESLADIARAKDFEGTKHLERVCLYAQELAYAASTSVRFRNEISEDFIHKIAEMTMLHDIGKVNIPDYLLQKQEPLSDRDFEIIKKHTMDGARTIDMIRLSFPEYGFLDFARDIILYHHERWDGTGYPEARVRLETPLSARIVAIADTFESITARHSYADPQNFEAAFDEILSGKGTAFDPDLVEVFRLSKNRIKDVYEKNKD